MSKGAYINEEGTLVVDMTEADKLWNSLTNDQQFAAMSAMFDPLLKRATELLAEVESQADRIEALEAERGEAVLQSLAHLGQAEEAYKAQLAAEAERDELQAKLDKAVGAFQNIVAIGRCDFEDIRVLLAELEDKSDD